MVLNTRLDIWTTKLVLDDLIRIYHGYKEWSLSYLVTKSSWEYTIDLTCLEHVSEIENAKKEGKLMELTQFHFQQ